MLRLRRRLRCLPSATARTGGSPCSPAGAPHSFPARSGTALTALLAAGELKVGDLPGLDPADRLTLARRLVTESVAVVPGAE